MFQGYSQEQSNRWKIEWFYIPAGLGFGVIALVQIRHIWKRESHSGVSNETLYVDEPNAFVFKPWQVVAQIIFFNLLFVKKLKK